MSKIRQKPDGIISCNERVRIVTTDWDAMMKTDLLTEEGFRITEKGKTDKDVEPGTYSIHSPLYGTDWGDANAFEDRWSCACGKYVGKYYADKDFVCPDCKKPVEYIGVNMKKRGWIVLDRNKLIQPYMFKKLEAFIGKSVLDDIIQYNSTLEDNGRQEPLSPYSKIGLIEFEEKFEEIMEFFVKKNKKMELYIFIMSMKNCVFVQGIPVYSALMRHFRIEDGKVKYTDDDKIFKRLYTNHELLNNDFSLGRRVDNVKKRGLRGVERLRKENILYKMQIDLGKLWDFSFEALDGKSGIINGQIIAGRMDYTARNVIVPDPTLRMDQVDIGYITALELFKLEFIDFTVKMYDISHKAAWNIWREATMIYSERVHNILTHLITVKKRIISIYRNPSINYGSRLVVTIRKINKGIDDHCLALSPQILQKPNADFDGDILNEIFHKIDYLSDEFYRRLNPRSNFMISRNDGLFDMDSNLFKDQAVILYGFLNI